MKFLIAILSIGFVGFSAQAAEPKLKCKYESEWTQINRDRNLEEHAVQSFEISSVENNPEIYQLTITSTRDLRAKDPQNVSDDDKMLINMNSKFGTRNLVIAKDLKCQFSDLIAHCSSSSPTDEDVSKGIYIDEFNTEIITRKYPSWEKMRAGVIEVVESSKLILHPSSYVVLGAENTTRKLENGFRLSDCRVQ